MSGPERPKIPPRQFAEVGHTVTRVPFGADVLISYRALDRSDLTDREYVLAAFFHLCILLKAQGYDPVMVASDLLEAEPPE